MTTTCIQHTSVQRLQSLRLGLHALSHEIAYYRWRYKSSENISGSIILCFPTVLTLPNPTHRQLMLCVSLCPIWSISWYPPRSYHNTVLMRISVRAFLFKILWAKQWWRKMGQEMSLNDLFICGWSPAKSQNKIKCQTFVNYNPKEP